jgi:formate/nitrite transporter
MADEHHETLNVIPPARIAQLVEEVGVAKVGLSADRMATLAVLAGAFIALGALYFTVVVTGSTLGFGPTRLLGGFAFSLGLILVVVGGAELFTGNALIVMAWADRRIGLGALARNWLIVYVGNFVGAAGVALLVHLSGVLSLNGGGVGETASSIASAKVSLTPLASFARGILCNVLVCLAVWLCIAARTVVGKVAAIVFPISAFVAAGLEHSVANMYFLPLAILHGTPGVTIHSLIANMVPVTLGNIVGGAVLVALVYWICYLRRD